MQTADLKPKKLHTEKEIAEITGLKTKRLQQFRTRGGGPPFKKLGASVFYDLGEVEAWISENTIVNTSEVKDHA